MKAKFGTKTAEKNVQSKIAFTWNSPPIYKLLLIIIYTVIARLGLVYKTSAKLVNLTIQSQ